MLLDNNDLNKEQNEQIENETEVSSREGSLLLINQKQADQLSRLTADFENFKRRVEIDKRHWYASAKGEVILKLLPFYDEILLAIAAEKRADPSASSDVLKGLDLIAHNFFKNLTNLGVTETTYDSFDPEFHEALTTATLPDKNSGDIVEVLKRGFLLDGRIIRHAQVVVAE